MADNSPLHEIQEALERLIAGDATSIDEELLRSTLQNSQYSIAIGERAMAISGNATDAIIITGDGNKVYTFSGLDAKALDTIAQLVRKTLVLQPLLTPEQFSKRVEREALVPCSETLVGRELLLEKIREELAGDTQVLVLYGLGGIGKTRILLSLPDCIPPSSKIWFLRTEAESVEYAIASLDRENHLVLVIDDAHRFLPLKHIREVLINPEFTNKVTIVLTTRPIFKDTVLSELSPLNFDLVSLIEVDKLTNADIDHLLQRPSNMIANESVRHALVRMADGNPLFAFIAARLNSRGAHIVELTRDQVLTHYLDDIIQDLARVNREHYEDYVKYLDILAAMGTLEIHNQALMKQVHQIAELSQQKGNGILATLKATGLIVQYGTILTITSEVLADHILFHHFFDPQTKHVDYLQFIIDPFITLKPKDILKRLAMAEIKGKSLEASTLLGNLLDLYSQAIKTEGNAGKLQGLALLQDIAYFRSDDILAIVVNIIDTPAPDPETIRYPGWGIFEISHEMILNQVIDLLGKTIYGLSLDDTIICLHKLATYQLNERAYLAVRDKAKHALTSIAAFMPGKPYTVQLKLLEYITYWIEQDFSGNLKLCLVLILSLLSMSWETTEDDPTKPSTITIKWGLLEKQDLLQEIRQSALDILYKAYPQSNHLIERLQIIQALEGAIPYARPDIEIPLEIKIWLQPDLVKTSHFLSEIVITTVELPVLDAVDSWLSRAMFLGKYRTEELLHIQQQLRNHRLYQLFRLFIGRSRLNNEDDRLNWRANEQHRREEIEHYIEYLCETTITQAIQDLLLITEQVHLANRSNETYWLDLFLEWLGERSPGFACQLIEQALVNDSAIKNHLGFMLIGLRRSHPEKVQVYINPWVTGNDESLFYIAMRSFYYIEWGQMQKSDWDMFCNLVAKGLPQIDWDTLSLMPSFAPYRPELATAFLKEIATRGDNATLRRVADILAQRDATDSGWIVEIANVQDYLTIFQNFERLSECDHEVAQCLNRLGQFDPMLVIDFLEQRIVNAAGYQVKDKRYCAIPLQFTLPLESIHISAIYRDVLQRICNWMLHKEPEFFRETPQVLKVIANNLDEVLYSVLMEWISSGDIKKQEAVARLLHRFNDGQTFYDLCRELIIRTDNKAVLNSINAAIGSTPISNIGMFAPYCFHNKRIEELSLWLQDSNFRVRRFAQKETQHFQKMLEFDEGLNRTGNWS